MIISHQHQFIFVAIPKTGTHAVRFALRPHLGKHDEEQVGLFQESKLNHPKLAAFRNGHLSALEGKKELDYWDRYISFSFVRNPYARFVSFAHYFYGEHPIMQRHPTLHLKNLLLFPPKDRVLWLKPQVDFLCNKEGEIIINEVGKVECLQQDYDDICQQLKLPTSTLARVNMSSHRSFQSYYDEELAEMIYKYYEQDFLTFQYHIDSWKKI